MKNKRAKRSRDITGNKYNMLFVVRRTEERSGTHYKWLCKCDCGNYTKVTMTKLKKGYTKSCGCLVSEDLIGKTFGMLTVLEDSGKRNYRRTKIWLCECECGNEYEVRTDSLTSGNTSSCGCLSESKGEKRVREYLETKGINYKEEYTFKDLVHINPLRYDFCILDDEGNLLGLIEYDGRQHFEPVEFFGGEEGYKYTVMMDQIKNEYAEKNDIPLLRIPYTQYDEIEKILDKELKKENIIC